MQITEHLSLREGKTGEATQIKQSTMIWIVSPSVRSAKNRDLMNSIKLGNI